MSRTRHLVDPELLALLDIWPSVTADETTLPLMRDPNRLPMPEISNPEQIEKLELLAPGREGAPDVPLTLYRPASRAAELLPCIYHIHGGGYISGQTATMEPLLREWASALACAIVTVEYRLAPEAPFPAPLEDCYTGLLWLFAQAEALGLDSARIGVKGESAGGGLAAALALLARDRGEVRLAFQHLAYPMLDDRTCTGEPNPFAGEFKWTPPSNLFAWKSYLAAEPGSDTISPYAAPARAGDLSGLPPAFIATGALDLFVDENLAYAARLIRAGVATELHVYPGGFHGFDLAPLADVACRARRDTIELLRRHLHPAAAVGPA